jgi:hypothetical protein
MLQVRVTVIWHVTFVLVRDIYHASYEYAWISNAADCQRFLLMVLLCKLGIKHRGCNK